MGKVMVSMIAGAAATLVATGATWAQPLVVTSQRFTFELPGQASQFLEPATQGTVDRNATFTQNLSGAFGGTGTLQTTGTARGSTSWTPTTISWSAEATIANSILEPFEVDDYAEVGLRAQMITEVRFQISAALQVQITRGPAITSGTGPDFLADVSLPRLFPLDSSGEPIINQGMIIDYGDPARTLQPGEYLARIRSAAIYVTSLGNAPAAGSSSVADSATLVVVPGPGSLTFASVITLFAARRRRR